MQAPVGAHAAEAKALLAEANVAWIRFAVIVFNVATYWPFLHPQGAPPLALVVSVVALIYGTYVVVGRPYERFPVLATSAWTAVTDSLLITLWLHATGGFDSPYYLLWFLSLIAIAFRYDWRATAITSGVYVLAYAGIVTWNNQWPGHETDMLVRLSYVTLSGALAALLAHESRRVFDERFAMGQALQEADRLQAMAEATQEGLAITVNGTIVEVNQALVDLMGVARKELVGTDGLAFVEDASRGAAAERSARPQADPIDLQVRTARGTRTFRVQSRPIQYRSEAAFLTSIRDITDEEQARQAREEAMRAALEVDRLKELDRFKTDFVNMAAHELNTPLTPLQLELHTLKARLASTKDKTSLDLLERNLQRLSGLVGDLLEVSRLESGRLELKVASFDLYATVRTVAETFAKAASQKGLQVHVSGQPLPLRGDVSRVEHVLYNLVSNAVKFTSKGDIRIDCLREGDMNVVRVTDTGLGLTAKQIEELFRPFARVHRDASAAPGTGLGLYISKVIATRHGGSLHVESDGPGQGAVFELRLPDEPLAPGEGS